MFGCCSRVARLVLVVSEQRRADEREDDDDVRTRSFPKIQRQLPSNRNWPIDPVHNMPHEFAFWSIHRGSHGVVAPAAAAAGVLLRGRRRPGLPDSDGAPARNPGGTTWNKSRPVKHSTRFVVEVVNLIRTPCHSCMGTGPPRSRPARPLPRGVRGVVGGPGWQLNY